MGVNRSSIARIVGISATYFGSAPTARVMSEEVQPPVNPPPTDWVPLPQGLGVTFAGNGCQAVATDGAGVWVASFGWSGESGLSVDNCATWTALPAGLNAGGGTATLRDMTTDGKGVWMAVFSSGWASRSVDNGATWAALPRYLDQVSQAPTFTALGTDGAGVWIAGGGSGYAARSTDDGATWTLLEQGLGTGETVGVNEMECGANGVWVASLGNGFAARSTDNGATWSALPQGLNSGETTEAFLAIATDGAGVWVACAGGGWASRSTDNGATWSALPRGLNSGAELRINGIATDRQGTWVAGLDDGRAALSTDNGATWSALPKGLNCGDDTARTFTLAYGNGRWLAGFGFGWMATSPELPPPAPEPEPEPQPPVEEEELKDVAYLGSSHSLSESSTVPEFDTLLTNSLGGTFDLAGADTNYPYCWEAPQDGWYKVQVYQRVLVDGFDPSDTNAMQLVHSWNGNWSDSTNGFANEYCSIQVPAGFPEGYYDTRTVTKYFAMLAGQKLQLGTNMSYIQTPNAGLLSQELTAQTSIEFTRIGDYTPS